MRLAALIRVKFSGDIIEEFARHTLQFVDRIYVVDNASVDATPQILQSLVAEGLPMTVWYDDIHEPAPEIMTGYTRRVFQEDAAEYVLLTDADGFLKARSRAHLEAALGGLPRNAHATVPWTTYVPTPNDPDDPQLLTRIQYRRADETPQYSKIIVSRSFVDRQSAEIMPGNHGISDPGGSLETIELAGVQLAFFPVRSISQLQGSALLAWSSFLVMGYDKDKALGYQWRRLYEELRENPSWDDREIYHRASAYLGEEHAITDLVLDPLHPVERRYLHATPDLTAVSISYTRQLTAYCVRLKNERTRLQSEVQAARGGKFVFIHAGTHKTGTSAIQALLGTQYETLAKDGIFVPLPGGNERNGVLAAHHEAATRFAEGVEPNLPFQALQEALRRNDLPIAVLSSENFECLYRNPGVLERIATRLGFCGYEAYVVLYFRQQSSYAESLYAELVKHGLNLPFRTYLEGLLGSGAASFKYWSYCFDYATLADRFADAFGADHVVLRAYRPERKDDFLLRDFLAAIAGAGNSDIVTQPERVNQSMTFFGVLENLYARSPHRPADAPDPTALIERTLEPNERAFLANSFKILEREDEMRIIDRFREENQCLAERYGIELADDVQRKSAGGESPQMRIMRAAEAAWVLDGYAYTGDAVVSQTPTWIELVEPTEIESGK